MCVQHAFRQGRGVVRPVGAGLSTSTAMPQTNLSLNEFKSVPPILALGLMSQATETTFLCPQGSDRLTRNAIRLCKQSLMGDDVLRYSHLIPGFAEHQPEGEFSQLTPWGATSGNLPCFIS